MQRAAQSRTYVPMEHHEILQALSFHRVFVIKKTDRVVGSIIFTVESDHVMLDELVVEPEFRGQGFGAEALAEFFGQHPGRTIKLVTHPDNPAKRLYERMGFEVYGVLENVYGDGEPRVQMSREPAVAG